MRNLDDAIKASLRLRAARHGRSMEEEARIILCGALVAEPAGMPEPSLTDAIQGIFAPPGGLDLPPRDLVRAPPDVAG